MSRQTVNIVGGGLAGLLAAVELSRRGVKVAVFEAAGELGGRARTRNANGFLLNQGPHALYMRGALKRELDRLGIPYSGARLVSGSRKAIARGKLHELPTSLEAIATTSLFGIRDKLAYARVFKAVRDGATGEGAFADWLDAQRLSPMVRASVEAVARLAGYANGPAYVSARAMLDQMRLTSGGTLYLDGGWASLVDALERATMESGVELNRGVAVERLVIEGRQSRLDMADKTTRIADATILAVGPHEAAAIASGIPSLALEAREARPVRANTLDLALERLPPKAHDFALGIDAPVYFSHHSGSAKLAPDGGAVVHLAKYLPVGEGPARDAVVELESVADLVMPGWRPYEVRRQTLIGMVVANGLPRWDRPRPAIEIGDAPGVFIAGDWVGDEGMIADAAAASAVGAAQAAMAWLAESRLELFSSPA